MQEVSQQQFGIVGNEVELSVEHIMQMKVIKFHKQQNYSYMILLPCR